VDISSPEFEEKIEAVDTILSSLHLGDKRRLLVFNKIDKVDRIFVGRMADRYHASFISAAKREGIEGLVETIEALTGEHT
jgi:GTP-binding protein HflX